MNNKISSYKILSYTIQLEITASFLYQLIFLLNESFVIN